MTYRLDLPDGTYYEVPDDMPREVAEQKARERHPELYRPRQETFGGAVMKGGKQLLSDVQMLGETPFVGKNEAVKRALERSQALQEQYGTGADFSRVKEAYGKSGEGLLPAAGELVKQSGLAMTEMIPYIAEMGIASKLGAKGGSPLTGLGLGAYVPRVAQNIQEQATAQQEAGRPIDVDLGKAASYAVPRAALDVAASVLPLGKTLAGKLFGDDVVKLLEMGGATDAEMAARSRLAAAARGIGVNLAEQVPIQVAQAALGRLQLGKPLLTEDAIKEYEHAGYVAGLMSPMGAIGGLGERSAAIDRLNAQSKPAEPTAETAPPSTEQVPASPDTSARVMPPAPEIQEELFAPEDTYSNKPFTIKDLTDEQLADVYGSKQPDTSTPFQQALPRSQWGQEEAAPTEPKQFEERPTTAPTTTPYSGQGWLPGMEPSWQHQFDEQAEAQQRAASESLSAQSAEQLKLLTEINKLSTTQWVTPAFVAKTLGIDIAQARETMKTLENDGYIANPNKAGWFKPTEKVAEDAPSPPRARMIGAGNVARDEQRRAPMMGGFNLTREESRRAPMMGGRNIALDEQRRAPMIGGRNLFREEQADVSDTTSDTGRDVGSVGGEESVERGPARGTVRPVQQGRTEQPSTTEAGTDRLAGTRTLTGEPDEGTQRGESTLDTLKQTGLSLAGLSAEDRSRILRMPYVEAQQAMREANEPNVRWQMAADYNARQDAARRAAVRNETERLGSLARKEAPTRSERAVESLKKGNLGEALYHLTNEADTRPEGGMHPYPHGERSPLRYLARALFNTVHRGDIAEREKIIDAEIARRSQEIGETQNRSITEREKRDIRNRILNDHKLAKVDVLDVDGKLTAAGRIIYKAGKNGRPLVDKEGNLVRNFTPDSERLVPVTGKARLNTYSGEVETLGGSKVPKTAFAGAEVVVEKPRLTGEDKAIIDRLKQEGKLAEYDPKKNKFYFTEQGLNDRTILHEMLHAATVKVLKQYENEGTRKSLSDAQRIGAQELNKIYAVAKKQLGKEHAAALENIYEFAAHAATDKRFQQALAEIPAGMLGTVSRRAQPSLWNMFTRALAKMFGLDHANKANEGNALLNASQAIHDILSTPERGTDVPPLAERAPPNTGTARANESAEKINKAVNEGNDKELLKNIGRAPLDWSHISDTRNLAGKARDALSNMPKTLLDGATAFLSMDHLYQIYKKEVPAIKMVDDVINGRQASLLMRKMNLRENLLKIEKMVKDNNYSKTQMNNFHDIALQSTLYQVELLNRPEKKDASGKVIQRERKRVEGELAKRYDALPAPMKEMYKMLRDEYDRMSDEYVAKLVNGLNTTEAAKLRASYEAARIPVYLPLYRRGKYWLSYKNKAGVNTQAAFRSVRQRAEIAERLKNMGATEIKTYEKLSDLRENGPPPAGFLNDVLEVMKKKGIKDSAIYDAVYETYLEYLPAQSVRQRFRERENILGMERDTFQTYANVATSMETLLNNLDYAPKLDDAVAELRKQAGEYTHDEGIMSAVRNIEAQVKFARDPKISNTVNKLGFFNYTWYLAANASSAIVNLTHLPMVVYPLLWGKHGTGPTEAAFANAFKQFKYKGQGKELVPKGYEALYEDALRTGALFEHMGQELYDLRETSVEDYTGLTKRVFEKMNYMFTITDRMNREATLMAGYDLALREMGTTKERATAEQHAKASQDAIELVNKSYGTATLASGPRILQNSLARIMLTFKRFALNRMFILGRVFRDIFKGENQAVKDIAKRQMLGIYATAFAFSGVAGLPLYGAATMLANLLMDTDEDEPIDVDDKVRESVGDLAYRGPLNHYLNLAVSHRVGWNDMFWTDDPKRLAEVGVFTYALERALGPTYSQLMAIKPAAEYFANGQFERGLELMTPVAARNVMKAVRFGFQGATTKKGESIGDVNVYNAFMQGFGFAPADVSEIQSKSSAGLELQRRILAQRDALLDQYYAAYMSGDSDALDEVNAKIDRYSEKNPDYPIEESTKASSVRQREKRAQDAINGINFNPKLQERIMQTIGIEDKTQSFAKGGLVKAFAGGGHVQSYEDGGDVWGGDEDSMFAAMTPSQRKYMTNKISERTPDYLASIPDTAANMIPYVGGTLMYGALRPFTSAKIAQEAKDKTMDIYSDPVHRLLGIENKPGVIGRTIGEATDLATSGVQKYVPGFSDPRDAREAVDTVMLAGPGVARQVGRDVASLRTPSGREALKNFAAESLSSPNQLSYAVKPKGGSWLDFEGEGTEEHRLDYSLARMQSPLAAGADLARRHRYSGNSSEVANWAQKVIPRYIKNEMGTPDDPIRNLFDKEEGHVGSDLNRTNSYIGNLIANGEVEEYPPYATYDVLEARENAGYPLEGYAKTNAGKHWENVTDSLIKRLNISGESPEVVALKNAGILPGTPQFDKFKNIVNDNWAGPEATEVYNKHLRDMAKANGYPDAEDPSDYVSYDDHDTVLNRTKRELLEKMGVNRRLYSLVGESGKIIASNPYLFKDNLPASYVINTLDQIGDKLGFNEVINDLEMATNPELADQHNLPNRLRLDKNDLVKLTLPDAVRRSNQIAKWIIQNEQNRITEQAKNNAQKVVKSFDDGWSVVKFEHPDPLDENPKLTEPKILNYKDMKYSNDTTRAFDSKADYDLAAALQSESCRMGNCIGSANYVDTYFDRIKSNRSEAFSIRDPKNKAEVTMMFDKDLPSEEYRYTSPDYIKANFNIPEDKDAAALEAAKTEAMYKIIELEKRMRELARYDNNGEDLTLAQHQEINKRLERDHKEIIRDLYRKKLLSLANEIGPIKIHVRQIGGNAIKNSDGSQDVKDTKLHKYVQGFLRDYMKKYPQLTMDTEDLHNAGLVRLDTALRYPWLDYGDKASLASPDNPDLIGGQYIPVDKIPARPNNNQPYYMNEEEPRDLLADPPDEINLQERLGD